MSLRGDEGSGPWPRGWWWLLPPLLLLFPTPGRSREVATNFTRIDISDRLSPPNCTTLSGTPEDGDLCLDVSLHVLKCYYSSAWHSCASTAQGFKAVDSTGVPMDVDGDGTDELEIKNPSANSIGIGFRAPSGSSEIKLRIGTYYDTDFFDYEAGIAFYADPNVDSGAYLYPYTAGYTSYDHGIGLGRTNLSSGASPSTTRAWGSLNLEGPHGTDASYSAWSGAISWLYTDVNNDTTANIVATSIAAHGEGELWIRDGWSQGVISSDTCIKTSSTVSGFDYDCDGTVDIVYSRATDSLGFDLDDDGTVESRVLTGGLYDSNADGTADYAVGTTTIADNTVGSSKATATITPKTRLHTITCNDADGCTITLGETGALPGFASTLICLTANDCEIDDAANVADLSADPFVLADINDSVTVAYMTNIWVQIGSVDLTP